MSKGFLPEKGSPDALDLARLYPTAPRDQLDIWANQYNFANVDSFRRSIRKFYNLRRGTDTVRETIRKPVTSEPLIVRHQEANVPLKLQTKYGNKTIAFICDTHNPFQDEGTLSITERFLGELQPDYLIYGGDVNDFYQVSVFDKNPARLDNLQNDLSNTQGMFRRHRQMLPNAHLILLEGNHEYRWTRFLWSSMAAAASLDCLTIDSLYNLKEYEIQHINYEQGLMINGTFLALHGDIASIHSGYTAKRLYAKHGGCGIAGHCHRGGSFYKRDRFGTWGWWEGFCLCRLNPDWMQNPNWVQGFSLIHFTDRTRFYVEQIPIIDHAFMYGGREYAVGED